MSSSVGFLAYVLHQKEPADALSVRKNHAEKHLTRINKAELVRTEVGDGGSGFVGWSARESKINWQHFIRRENSGIAWIHIPSVAGGPESGIDEWDLAQNVLDSRVKVGDIGAPFSAVRWQHGQLEIVNDMLGLVRLFHFKFKNGDVWTTRPGLAHVFMGENPTKNRLAWSGMATLGWASSGMTQLGNGKQVSGGTRIRGGFQGGQRTLEIENNFGDWLEAARVAKEPTPETNVRDMELYMSTAKRWPRQALADLSGGKDSRVVAAIGIRSDAIKTVRTIRTDHGEVETAQRLMSLIDTEVQHRIDDRKDPSRPGGSFSERVGSQHDAWEGRFLAITAYNAPEFAGFDERPAPTFNGLGGEVMAGGQLLGAWHDRLINAPAGAATGKLSAMVNVALGATPETKETVLSEIHKYIAKAESFGLTGAAGVMDLFYHLDRMPNWSITYATPSTLTPLFAPSLLTYAAQRIGRPIENGEAHRRLLREAIPQWASVPFYKPTAKKRAVPFIWQNGDWEDIRDFVKDRLDQTLSFDPSATTDILAKIEAGEGIKRDEIFIQRFIWESTFDSYLEKVAREAKATAKEISMVLTQKRNAVNGAE
ncbi:hypothetical protein [Glutamicibacter ardleyensis]|uniref:hypothetical protein n=1 Tax=Glutamicibacter ardleyensis TaxID=225894 RepID=UPI003FD1212A